MNSISQRYLSEQLHFESRGFLPGGAQLVVRIGGCSREKGLLSKDISSSFWGRRWWMRCFDGTNESCFLDRLVQGEHRASVCNWYTRSREVLMPMSVYRTARDTLLALSRSYNSIQSPMEKL
ncbi:MAG: hypothetical protein DRI26_02140 [Chloroflexi bacterium]|nr:MAG: hypothetical protein DRI26_02140 [Chloroflexota bacterium]